jgi:sulfite exporter TauE/SafE
MSLFTEISNPYLASLALGLLSGLVFCTSSCLPYIAGYIAGVGAGFRKGVAITVIYNSGRVMAYALIGVAIGILKLSIDDAILTSYQNFALLALGLVSIVIGLNMILKSKRSACTKGCVSRSITKSNGKVLTRNFDPQAFVLGLTRGLIVCPLLVPVLLYSVTFSTPVDSFFLALLFGIGTALSPLMLIGGVTGWLLNKAPLFRKWISIVGGVVLIVLGISALVNAVTISS